MLSDGDGLPPGRGAGLGALSLRHEGVPAPNCAAAAYFPNPLKYFSASMAAAQPEPAAVIACL